MEHSIIYILLFGFLLGIKHAIEPDHIIAVSTIASTTKTIRRSVMAGVYWGIGHTFTLFLVGMFLIAGKNAISDHMAMTFEFCVGIMLVYLGVTSLHPFQRKSGRHSHPHETRGRGQKLKSFLIGLVHGLAGSAAMVLLTMSTVSTAWEGAVYILIFGCGTIVGMLSFSALIGLPFILSSGKNLNVYLNRIAGVVSTAFGIYYMYNLGVTEGLFSIWFY